MSNLHIAWARLFFRALASAGVRRVVQSPGSRSTPLALAAAEARASGATGQHGLEIVTLVDERSAGFFALGQARVTGEPTALLCTSGTAGAHYLPAIIEASQSFLPLVVITADRPWEAYDASAPQTIDQVKLFGGHVRHAAELGLPDPAPEAMRAVARIAAQAVHRARWPVPGPVHVNARFRKPLEPTDSEGAEPWEADMAALLERGAPRVYQPAGAPDDRAVRDLAAACAKARRGLIVCGPAPAFIDLSAARAAALELARATGFPLLVEATSQLRFGMDGARGATICGGFDAFLRARGFQRDHAPDLIVELHAPPTSSAYGAYLAAHPTAPRFVLAPQGWNDPSGQASAMVFGDPAMVLQRALRELGADARGHRDDGGWAASFARAEAIVWEHVARECDGAALTEGTIAHDVAALLPAGGVLAVGNSMPVRDLDAYAPPSSRPLTVLHQRGANGIDGLVSGAAGARSVCDGALALLCGDLSLLHDVGGLNAARTATRPLVIVAVHNDGGRIFEELPIARRPELGAVLEEQFVTPQGLDFAGVAATFGLRHARVTQRSALRAALAEALDAPCATLIEAVVPPRDAVARRARLRAEIAAALEGPSP